MIRSLKWPTAPICAPKDTNLIVDAINRDTEHWPWNETIQFCIHQVLIGRQIVAFVSQTTEKFSSNSEGGTEYY